MQTILILIVVLAIVIVPLVLVHFASQYKVGRGGLSKISSNEARQKDFKNWRLFGAILIMMSAGFSFASSDSSSDLASMPIYGKVGIFVLGSLIIILTNSQEKKLQQKSKTHFVVDKKGVVNGTKTLEK